jgi:hypothetical protein
VKKILILSINSLPLDVISSYRTKGYCDYFFEYGIYPTLLTTRYELEEDGSISWHEESDEVIKEVYKTHKIIRLPRVRSKLSKSSLHTFINFLGGNLDVELLSAYSLYKKFLFEHLEHNHYDLVLSIFSPHFHLKLAYEIKKWFGIPYVLDFRDLYNNSILDFGYKSSFKERIQSKIISLWWKNWINGALFFTITSKPWLEKLKEITRTTSNGFVVTNGYESMVDEISKDKLKNKKLQICHIGSIYNNQRLDIFFDGLKLFIESTTGNQPLQIAVKFIGANRKREGSRITGYANIPTDLVNFFREHIEFQLTERISKEGALIYLSKADLLIFPSFPTTPGTYSGKIFEFLGSKRQILAFPSDNGVLDDIICETKSGVVLDTAQEVCAYLEHIYSYWLGYGSVEYNGDVTSISKYSRKNQVKVSSKLIHSFLSSHK